MFVSPAFRNQANRRIGRIRELWDQFAQYLDTARLILSFSTRHGA
jgi:hypothetical protein